MLLATYQPLKADKAKENKLYDCFREKLCGDYPLFCIPARTEDEFTFRSITAEMHMPETLLFYDTDDFVKFDFVKWNNIKNLPRDDAFPEKFEDIFWDVDDAYAEYAIGASRLKEMACGFNIRAMLEDKTPTGSRVFNILHSQANQISSQSLTPGLSLETQAMIRQNAYATHIGWSAWGHATGRQVNPFCAIPFLPSSDKASLSAWERYNDIRREQLKPDHVWSYDEWEEMRREAEKAVGINRMNCFGTFDRNEPCPCGSGKKYKKCHYIRPVQTHPSMG